MSISERDPLAVLDDLKRCIQRMREIATNHPGRIGTSLHAIADDIAQEVAALEGELIEAGYLPRPANRP